MTQAERIEISTELLRKLERKEISASEHFALMTMLIKDYAEENISAFALFEVPYLLIILEKYEEIYRRHLSENAELKKIYDILKDENALKIKATGYQLPNFFMRRGNKNDES